MQLGSSMYVAAIIALASNIAQASDDERRPVQRAIQEGLQGVTHLNLHRAETLALDLDARFPAQPWIVHVVMQQAHAVLAQRLWQTMLEEFATPPPGPLDGQWSHQGADLETLHVMQEQLKLHRELSGRSWAELQIPAWQFYSLGRARWDY